MCSSDTRLPVYDSGYASTIPVRTHRMLARPRVAAPMHHASHRRSCHCLAVLKIMTLPCQLQCKRDNCAVPKQNCEQPECRAASWTSVLRHGQLLPFVNTSTAGWVWYACIHADCLCWCSGAGAVLVLVLVLGQVTPFVNTSIAGWVWYACIYADCWCWCWCKVRSLV